VTEGESAVCVTLLETHHTLRTETHHTLRTETHHTIPCGHLKRQVSQMQLPLTSPALQAAEALVPLGPSLQAWAMHAIL